MRFKEFLMEEDGMGTAEVVVIAGVLVAVALIFRDKIHGFVKGTMDNGLKSGIEFTEGGAK
ncbi:MAG: hypothetical protein JXO44_11055 [Clostridia bacterium]|nr:hypothetical protein [Clostridia bacterium]